MPASLALTAAEWRGLAGRDAPSTCEPLGADRGMSSALAHVSWGSESAVVKISHDRRRGARELAALQALDGRDVPHLLGALEQRERVILLLEDLTDATPGCILEGVDEPGAHAIMRVLGRIHRRFWLRPPSGWELRPPTFRALDDAVLDAFSSRYPASRALCRALPGHVARLEPVLAAAPATLCHADAHLDNWIFRPDPLLLDWETARMAPGIADVVRVFMEGLRLDLHTPAHVNALLTTWCREVDVELAQARLWAAAAVAWSLSAMIPHHATVDLDEHCDRMVRVHRRCVEGAVHMAACLLEE